MKKNMCYLKNNFGATLIELIAVIAIIAILLMISVPAVIGIIDESRISVDAASIKTLNSSTNYYSLSEDIPLNQVFTGTSSDAERMQKLSNEGYLKSIPEPQQKDVQFCWNNNVLKWGLSTHLFDFSQLTKEDYIAAGLLFVNIDGWVYNAENGTITLPDNGRNLAFFELGKSTNENYSIFATAILGEGSRGGYGINFDTILDNTEDKNDTGYIFQFDRGYGDGAFLIRTRTDANEHHPVISIGARDLLGFSADQDDAYNAWWVQEHDIQLDVVNLDATTRQIKAYVDNQEVLSYSYTNELDPSDTIYSGLRGWHNESDFRTIDIK